MSLQGILLSGLGLGLVSHLVLWIVRQRAEAQYRAILGPNQDNDTLLARSWGAMRTEVGVWGCLVVLLQFLRGGGLLAAGAAGLVLLFG